MAISPKYRSATKLIDTFSIYRGAMSILKVSIRQLKAARSLIGWSQEELASAAKISLPTIKRLEAVEGPLGGRQTTAEKIQAALEKAGIEFIDENGGGLGVRLRKRQQAKKTK
jgi:transcriptional regulator with XRE-family HTH domain